MTKRRLLLFSNSKNEMQSYLEHAERPLSAFLNKRIKRILFIPFAVVRSTYDQYASLVRERLAQFGYELESIHEFADPLHALMNAETVAVGGGNTFCLLQKLYETNLLECLKARAEEGMPYIGWSAGANIACPTIMTTNDMPIVEPPSFKSLGLIPFQINPHYTDLHPPGHQGETREDRILEYITVNPNVYVVGMREGSTLRVEGSEIELIGEKKLRIFRQGAGAVEYGVGESMQFLL